MPDCGTCDFCVWRATGVMPEGRPGMGILKYNTNCRSTGIDIVNLAEFNVPTFREVELQNSMAMAGCKTSDGRPVLTTDGQRVIRLGQLLMAEEAPPNGYVINLSMADMASQHVRETLFDYLQTVSLRFGFRQPIIDIRIRSNR